MGYINVDVQVGKKTIKKARMVIAREGKKSLVGRDWLRQLNFKVAEVKSESENEHSVNSTVIRVKLSPGLKRLNQLFPKVFKRQETILGHTIKVEFKVGAKITQQKGRRVPIHLQKAVDVEIKSLLEAGHIKKIDQISDSMFIEPILITVKKDRSVGIALEAMSLNSATSKHKYQMSNQERLMDNVAENVSAKEEGKVFFTSLDMQYAYGQTVLHPVTARHFNFQVVGGESTGTYAFNIRVYRLTIMPPKFQKIMDNILHGTKNIFTHIGDILTFTKGTKRKHLTTVEEALKVLNEAGVCLKIEKIAEKETEWLDTNCQQTESNR